MGFVEVRWRARLWNRCSGFVAWAFEAGLNAIVIIYLSVRRASLQQELFASI